MNNNRIKHSLIKNIPLITVCLFLTITICLYAPLSIYVANNQEFWFNLRAIWYIPVLTFTVSFLGSIIVGMFLKGKIRDIYTALLFGLGICFYIQGNFIGIKAGIINGNHVDWPVYYPRIALNALIWIVILAVVVFLFLKYKQSFSIAKYASILLCAMQLVSLTVLIFNVGNWQKELGSLTVPVLTNKGLFEVGREKNIIVFVLDSFDENYFDYIEENEPEILEEFDGFIEYDNFTSVYPATAYSLTGILNGSLFKNEMVRTEWVEENAKKTLYIDELTKEGYDVSLYTSELHAVPDRIRAITENYTESPAHFYNNRTCFAILYRLAGCQYFPDLFKPYLWMNGREIQSTGYIDSDYRLYDDSNSKFKDEIEKNGLTVVDGAKKYKFIHLFGTHAPCYTDEFGDEADLTWEWIDCSKGCLRIMAKYISILKESGVYDQSAIIITADHGNETEPGVLSNPFFMIKDYNSHGSLQKCHYEASLENYGATIADLAGVENTEQYGLSILDANENTKFDRYYYQFVYDENDYRCTGANKNDYLVEYLTPYDTNDTSLFKLTDVEYTPDGSKIPHIQNCEECQKTNETPIDCYGWDQLEHKHIKNFPY